MINRLDTYLYEEGYFSSREKAKSAIMAGIVYINDQKKEKPGERIKKIVKVEIKGNKMPYVSRGGLKLEKAFEIFNFKVKDMIAMDIGASTGGFTDCMLKNGAKKVYAVDVGYGQLDWKLRNNDNVINLERNNFRYLEFDIIGEKVDRATMDVSFISIIKLMPQLKLFLKDNGEAIILIKPQFEAGKEKVGKNGVVSNKSIHIEVLNNTLYEINRSGFNILGLDYSPIKGPKGNIEFICHIVNNNKQNENLESLIEFVVEKANNNLKNI